MSRQAVEDLLDEEHSLSMSKLEESKIFKELYEKQHYRDKNKYYPQINIQNIKKEHRQSLPCNLFKVELAQMNLLQNSKEQVHLTNYPVDIDKLRIYEYLSLKYDKNTLNNSSFLRKILKIPEHEKAQMNNFRNQFKTRITQLEKVYQCQSIQDQEERQKDRTSDLFYFKRRGLENEYLLKKMNGKPKQLELEKLKSKSNSHQFYQSFNVKKKEKQPFNLNPNGFCVDPRIERLVKQSQSYAQLKSIEKKEKLNIYLTKLKQITQQ